MAFAGLLAGLTVMFEYQAALVSVALAVYAGVRYRRRVAAVAAFVGGGGAAGGRAGRLSHGAVRAPLAVPVRQRRESDVRARPRIAPASTACRCRSAKAFPTFLFSPSYGLFAFSPVLALGVVGVVVLFVRGSRGARRDAVLVTAVCLLMFTFLAGMSNWRAGWCVGPRYIATVAPFLLLPLLKLWPRVGRKWWATAIVVGLTIPSVVLNVVSGALYPHYPRQFDNPVFDLAFPLLGAGYAPYGLGWLLHLRGVVGAGAARGGGAGGAGAGRGGRRSAAAARGRAPVAAVGRWRRRFCSALSAYGRKPSAAETHAPRRSCISSGNHRIGRFKNSGRS